MKWLHCSCLSPHSYSIIAFFFFLSPGLCVPFFIIFLQPKKEKKKGKSYIPASSFWMLREREKTSPEEEEACQHV
jgi:hypothetical protein